MRRAILPLAILGAFAAFLGARWYHDTHTEEAGAVLSSERDALSKLREAQEARSQLRKVNLGSNSDREGGAGRKKAARGGGRTGGSVMNRERGPGWQPPPSDERKRIAALTAAVQKFPGSEVKEFAGPRLFVHLVSDNLDDDLATLSGAGDLIFSVQLTGRRPARLKGLPKAASAFLGARLRDDDPAQPEGLTKLRELTQRKAPLTDKGMAHLKGLTALKQLSIANVPLTDEGMAPLRGLAGLVRLSIDTAPLTDAGLAHLRGHPGLETVCLVRTRVTDAGLEHLTTLPALKNVLLSGGPVTAAGARSLAGQVKARVTRLSSVRSDGTGRQP